jgi:glycosyltransferase involved in cell wall biosynthesis
MEYYALLKADVLIANSEASQRKYLLDYPDLEVHQSKMVVIDPPKFTTPCTSKDRTEYSTILIYVNQKQVNGRHVFVKAAVQFLESTHLEAKFVFVGQSGICSSSDRKCIWDLIPVRLHQQFSFINFIPLSELCTLAERVRIAVFASLTETFCLSAHEAYSIGIPLVISNISTIRPFFDESNSILFNPLKTESLVAALVNAFDDDNLKIIQHKMRPLRQSAPVVDQYQAVFSTRRHRHSMSQALDQFLQRNIEVV